jgi:tetrahydromethanopterin S-methyltransferase subunit G
MRIFDLINKIREYICTPEIKKPTHEPIPKPFVGDELAHIGEINKKLNLLDENLEFIEKYLSKKFGTFKKKGLTYIAFLLYVIWGTP